MTKVLIILIAACGPSTALGLGIPASLADKAEVLDAGIRILDEETELDVTSSITGTWLFVESNPFRCAGVITEGGCHSSGRITIVYRAGELLSESAFLHEVAHATLCKAGDCDAEHEQMDVWEAVNRANHRWYDYEVQL